MPHPNPLSPELKIAEQIGAKAGELAADVIAHAKMLDQIASTGVGDVFLDAVITRLTEARQTR